MSKQQTSKTAAKLPLPTKANQYELSEEDYSRMIEKLVNIATQDISHIVKSNNSKDQPLNQSQIYLKFNVGSEGEKDASGQPLGNEIYDCIKSFNYDNGYGQIELHDPLAAMNILIHLGILK